MLARYGGEEFLITMPDTNVEEASHAAERLCRKISDLRIKANKADPISVTLSIGLAVRVSANGPPATVAQELLSDADRALYAAKSEGRNQVTLSKNAA